MTQSQNFKIECDRCGATKDGSVIGYTTITYHSGDDMTASRPLDFCYECSIKLREILKTFKSA